MSCNLRQCEQRLGELAMEFRDTKDKAERDKIAVQYADTVEALIRSTNWDDVPAPEDQLPDNWMPTAFFQYWDQRYPAHNIP